MIKIIRVRIDINKCVKLTKVSNLGINVWVFLLAALAANFSHYITSHSLY